jgi:hypothetical protein
MSAATNIFTATYTNTDHAQSTEVFTITINPTTITPFLEVNGGAWQNASSVTVAPGAVVNLGPQPLTGGTWSWSGPNGFTSSARQINGIALSVGGNTYVATYTNADGVESVETFTVTVE